MDYMIHPVKMGGQIKEISDNLVKVHLHGRLGVVTVPKTLVVSQNALKPGYEVEFYFSYMQIVEQSCDYDSFSVLTQREPYPCLLGGVVAEVNDTAVKVAVTHDLGTIAVPRRWVFTPVTLEEELNVEFYFSCMKVVGKLDFSVE